MRIEHGGRRSGRTLRALQPARDGDVVVVSHLAEKKHCERLLSGLGRRSNCLRFVTIDNLRALRGSRMDHAVHVDHAVEEMTTGEQWAELMEILKDWQS